jgi:hypothetical protein
LLVATGLDWKKAGLILIMLFFDGITSGLSDTMSSPAPNDQKTCYLYRVNSKFSPYTCDWQNAMNHFEYLQETSDDVLTNGDKQRAYKGRGGIDMHCHPFDLCELWADFSKTDCLIK